MAEPKLSISEAIEVLHMRLRVLDQEYMWHKIEYRIKLDNVKKMVDYIEEKFNEFTEAQTIKK